MATLRIELLGGLFLTLDNEPLFFPSRKADALLAYLICRQQPFGREHLAELLWAESSPKQALANLRKLLTACRKQAADYLIIDRQSVAFNVAADYWCDVEEFLAAAGDNDASLQQLNQAVELHKGDFLAGFFLRESYLFDEWAAVKREQLRLTAARMITHTVTAHLHRQQYGIGIRQTQQLINLDPLNERAHRLLMRMLARNGERNAALAHYTQCAALLERELGVPPLPETTAVYQRIRQSPPRPHHFPRPATPLIGRQNAAARLNALLDNHQLVTLLGPGGSGKSRLALDVTADRTPDYQDGIYFVPLNGTAADSAGERLSAALVAALALPAHTSRSQLLHFLQERELLLVLDNGEQITAARSLLQQLLHAAPGVSWLLTSQHALQLTAEMVFPLHGLAPDDAAAFFTRNARRSQGLFSPSDTELQEIATICRLLDGLPLPLALAAAAAPAFSPGQIRRKLAQDLELISSRARDLPPRQRSAVAMFTYAWDLLSADEQAAYCHLLRFTEPFTAAAARENNHITQLQLTNLAMKSFLLHDSRQDVYQHYALLRRCAKERSSSSSTSAHQ